MIYLLPTVNGFSSIQQIIASCALVTKGISEDFTIRSPRPMSISSFRCSTAGMPGSDLSTDLPWCSIGRYGWSQTQGQKQWSHLYIECLTGHLTSIATIIMQNIGLPVLTYWTWNLEHLPSSASCNSVVSKNNGKRADLYTTAWCRKNHYIIATERWNRYILNVLQIEFLCNTSVVLYDLDLNLVSLKSTRSIFIDRNDDMVFWAEKGNRMSPWSALWRPASHRWARSSILELKPRPYFGYIEYGQCICNDKFTGRTWKISISNINQNSCSLLPWSPSVQ